MFLRLFYIFIVFKIFVWWVFKKITSYMRYRDFTHELNIKRKLLIWHCIKMISINIKDAELFVKKEFVLHDSTSISFAAFTDIFKKSVIRNTYFCTTLNDIVTVSSHPSLPRWNVLDSVKKDGTLLNYMVYRMHHNFWSGSACYFKAEYVSKVNYWLFEIYNFMDCIR